MIFFIKIDLPSPSPFQKGKNTQIVKQLPGLREIAMKRLEEISEKNQISVTSTTQYDDFTATEGIKEFVYYLLVQTTIICELIY